jgi:hypothetical protein
MKITDGGGNGHGNDFGFGDGDGRYPFNLIMGEVDETT